MSGVWGMVADLWGRKPAFAAAAGLTCVAGLASAAAPSFWVGGWVGGSVGLAGGLAAHLQDAEVMGWGAWGG